MDNFNFSDPLFLEIIKNKGEDIQKLMSNTFRECNEFKLFEAGLKTFIDGHFYYNFLAISIKKNDLLNIQDNFYKELEKNLNSDEAIHFNHIFLDSSMSIIDKRKDTFNNSNDARHYYTNHSKNYIVFLLHPTKDISFFIDGEDFGKPIFFRLEDYLNYQQKKSISDIDILFDDYRDRYLKLDTICSKFFVHKSQLRSLHKDTNSQKNEKDFLNDNKHLLKNSPENSFRDDLKEFLRERLKGTVNILKESWLENWDRLDIHLIDEDGFGNYLIEVKWVGESIKDSGKEFGTKMYASTLKNDAVNQSLRYLAELNRHNRIIKIAYLVVFDARSDENLEDTILPIDTTKLDKELYKFYNHFRKVPDFRVVNNHPA